MYGRTKELIKQLAAELEFVTLPAMDRVCQCTFGESEAILRNNYEAAKDMQHDLKALYKILDNYIEQ